MSTAQGGYRPRACRTWRMRVHLQAWPRYVSFHPEGFHTILSMQKCAPLPSLCWWWRSRLCTLSHFGTEQGDGEHGGAELDETKEGQRGLEVQLEHHTEEKAS